MIDLGKRNVLGVRIDVVDYQAAVARVLDAAQRRQPMAVSALAVHGVMTGVLDRTHRHRLNQFDLLVPDGQPVRWALRWLHGTRLEDRVYGPRLMLEICRRAAEEQLPIYLYGNTEPTIQALSQRLVDRFPALCIAGTCPSKFRRLSPEERDEAVRRIHDSGAVITFVGLGCPRQEVWAYELRERLSMPALAVGAAFDFHAGHLPQAPKFMQDRGLEWLYRLVQEPRRLWKRYLLLNPAYLGLLALQKTGMRKFDPQDNLPPREEIRYG